MAAEGINISQSYRRALTMAAAGISVESGFDTAENIALETLCEMLQSYISEIGNSTRSLYEHSGRTLPTGRDVACALADIGFSNKQLLQYIKQPRRITLGQLTKVSDPSPPPVLQVGKRRGFPSFIPENYNYPDLPDPHTYIRTTTGQKPETDYIILRSRVSAQKRDVERALTRFVAKTGKSHPLLPDDRNAFPLIVAKTTPCPYLSALLPSEHETLKLCENDSQEDAEETTGKETDTPKSKDRKSKRRRTSTDGETSASREGGAQDRASAEQQQTRSAGGHSGSASKAPVVIRNPYLRPVKRPKLKKKAR